MTNRKRKFQRFGSRVFALCMFSALASVSEACKPRRSEGYGVKSDRLGSGCVGEVASRIDTMGIRVEDAAYGGGVRVACVEPNLGLHVQYGLQKDDVILALNRNTTFTSAADFEEKIKVLEADFEEPISAWEFTVERGGQKLILSAKADWGGCIPESFTRCGSVIK